MRPPSSRARPDHAGGAQGDHRASPVAGVYDKLVDRESASEMLVKRKTQRTEQREYEEKREDTARKRHRGARRQPRAAAPRSRQSVEEAAIKSFTRSVAVAARDRASCAASSAASSAVSADAGARRAHPSRSSPPTRGRAMPSAPRSCRRPAATSRARARRIVCLAEAEGLAGAAGHQRPRRRRRSDRHRRRRFRACPRRSPACRSSASPTPTRGSRASPS